MEGHAHSPFIPHMFSYPEHAPQDQPHQLHHDGQPPLPMALPVPVPMQQRGPSAAEFSTWDYLESLSDEHLLSANIGHMTSPADRQYLHQPQLHIDPSQQHPGSTLLTPASTHPSPSSASTSNGQMTFSVPALSPAGSPSTTSSLEPLPPRMQGMTAAPATMVYNPYPYHGAQQYASSSSHAQPHAHGHAYGTSFEQTMFFKQTLPCGRQRIEQACEKCRERKAKCNGGRPACKRCVDRGLTCVYASERRMRGPNRLKKQVSRGVLPRSSTVSLSSAHSATSPSTSRDGGRSSPPESAGTGTPSPTEGSFREYDSNSNFSNAMNGNMNVHAPGVSAGPRKVASTGNLADKRLSIPSLPGMPLSAHSPLATTTSAATTIVRPSLPRSASTMNATTRMLPQHAHHRSDSGSGSGSSSRPRLSVEAPPEPDSLQPRAADTSSSTSTSTTRVPVNLASPLTRVLHLHHQGLARPELGLGVPVPTFGLGQPQAPGHDAYAGAAYAAHPQALDAQAGYMHLPSADWLPAATGPADGNATVNGMQYLAPTAYHMPYGMSSYPPGTDSTGALFLPQENESQASITHSHSASLAAKYGHGHGQGGTASLSASPSVGGAARMHQQQPLSPAQLAYYAGVVEEAKRHSRTPSDGTAALSASPSGSITSLQLHGLPPLPTQFASLARPFDGDELAIARTGTAGSGSTSASDTTSSGSSGLKFSPSAAHTLSPAAALGMPMHVHGMHGRSLSLSALASGAGAPGHTHSHSPYEYVPITPPDSGSGSAAAGASSGPGSAGISPQRTLGNSVNHYGY